MRLSLRNLGKRYPNGHRAVAGLTLELSRGIVGLLGPNGAGKTTTLGMLATTAQPTEGEILVDGRPLRSVLRDYQRRLGYLPQHFELPALLEVHEVLEFMGGLCGLSCQEARNRTDQLLETVGLARVRHRRVKHLSVGMTRRLGIAQSLVGDPDVLFVDEPTTGLDPEERNRFCSLLARLGREKTVVFSTHIVSDVEAVVSRVVVLDGGVLAYDGAPSGFVSRATGHVYRVLIAPEELEALSRRHHLASVREEDGRLCARIVIAGTPPPEAVPAEPTFEDAYLYHFRVLSGAEPRGLWTAA
ncbi:ABC transporter ATP-binding protein [bacterium]|nr:ABC transporter ATP-binding protein [bacterium]